MLAAFFIVFKLVVFRTFIPLISQVHFRAWLFSLGLTEFHKMNGSVSIQKEIICRDSIA
jgi:hypothetical protein